MAKMSVKAECAACDGSGVYHGFAEPRGVGVVCVECKGTGCREISYTPFTERKRRTDIRTVQRSRGSFIATGVGPRGSAISYEEFLNGRMPD